jgi:inosose dehydratase
MTYKTTQTTERSTRRRFLQVGGLAAAGSLLAAKGSAAQETPSKKWAMKLGMASYSLRKFNLDETLKMTQRVGLKYICLKSFHLPMDSTPEQIAKVADKVKDAGITLYGGGVITMRDKAAVDLAFDYAKAAGMKTIVGTPAPGLLSLVEEKVKQYDIQVAIHNHGPGDTIYPTPAHINEKIKGLDARIGICHDIGHTLRYGSDPIRETEQYAARMLDFHAKDVSAATPGGKAVEVGRGVIDIPKFIATLRKIEYNGIVSFEYEKDAADPLPGLAESVGYMRGVLSGLQ